VQQKGQGGGGKAGGDGKGKDKDKDKGKEGDGDGNKKEPDGNKKGGADKKEPDGNKKKEAEKPKVVVPTITQTTTQTTIPPSTFISFLRYLPEYMIDYPRSFIHSLASFVNLSHHWLPYLPE
jgi:hypothetical protein